MNYDIEILARTIYGEASNQPFTGKLAVASVVMNRVRKGFAKDAASVCLAPKQFSCWNANDPGPGRIARVTADSETFQECMAAALCAYNTLLPDPTFGADHYYADYIPPPIWASSMKQTVKIGPHIFLKS
jgi:spore germination cell wall hydrolase CwlJ-like protein